MSGYTSRDHKGAWRGAGFNLGHGETNNGTTTQAVNVYGDVGWGGDRGLYGGRGGATLAGVSHDPAAAGESGFWGGIRVGDAGASAYHDTQSGSGEIGYRADIISGEVGYREVDPNSDNDRGFRVGGAVGAPSGALRWYNQDADGDHENEYGLGVSVPIPGTPFGVSADYTTETPVGDVATTWLMGMALGPAALSAAPLLNEGMEAVGLEDYSPSRVIQDGAESAWDTVTGWLD